MKIYKAVILLFMVNSLAAQKIPSKFVTINDLLETDDDVFKDIPAKIVFRNIYFEFGKVFEVHERVKIYNKEGLEYSNWEIPFDEIESLKATTYNLEDGKIIKTKVTSNSIYMEEVEEDYQINKITFPNVKVGSIIELSYKLSGVGLKNIYCQSSIPIKKFKLVLRNPNYVNLNVAENSSSIVQLKVEEKTKEIIYSGENIAGLKFERYLGGINNYRGRLFLEIAYAYGSNKLKRWSQVAAFYNEGKNGFKDLLSMRKVYKKDLKIVLGTEQDLLIRAKRVYSFVQKNIKWNNYYSRGEIKLEKVYNNKEGSVGAINLILIAMLRDAGIKAYPMLIASKSNGFIKFPTIIGFNNTIACVQILDKKYLVDASRKFANFGELPISYVNGDGLVLYGKGLFELLTTRTRAKSKTSTNINASINTEDLSLSGRVENRISGYYAWDHRLTYENNVEGIYQKELEDSFNFLEIDNLVTKDFKNIDKPITLYYDFTLGDYVEKINNQLYIEPFIIFGEKENYFKQENRIYPIDFLYPTGKNLIINFDIPKGYRVESVPKSKDIQLSDNVASLIFKSEIIDSKIKVILSLQINYSIVSAKYYQEIKNLFSEYISITKSKIVLSKK